MEDSNYSLPVALKEWAVAVKALSEGKQIMVLRKGGIAEETRDFQLLSPSFYLLPAFEHQKPELLKEAYRSGVEETIAQWRQHSDTVRISAYAEVAEDIEIRDQETLDSLRDYHIWTDSFAEERLKWKRTKPLHLLLLRVFLLDEPVNIPMRDAYMGCKSWVTLEGVPQEAPSKPVLEDMAFNEQILLIKEKIGL
ncbi:hypothetical protein PAECIP111893_01370 [Paenibacillus plantiphilus]|uniref:DUF1802 family protein n=1 Tax=Paenibacillus plantiphilus TaxID=2905650 RepID=A0ABN8GAJ5_9BACL|nr:DUF1802 family protein [Paenibacillus plantiphilus]CAH1200421.1 hypothetical protein PAECIP111893_01370 [Paenibacillus plantiphilus]